MSHLKFSNFAKKRKVPATIHTYIFIALCLCVCVCVVLPVGRDVGGLCACESCLVTRWHAQWPIHHGAKLCVRVCTCMCDCVWECAKVAKFKDKSLRKAQQKGSNKQRRNWNSQKATCTHTRTHSHTHTHYTLWILQQMLNVANEILNAA